MKLRVVAEQNVRETLGTYPPGTKRRIKAALAELANDPSAPGPQGNIKRLDVPDTGTPVLRIRIGDHRAVLVVRGPEVRVLKVFHRREGYDWLARLRLD